MRRNAYILCEEGTYVTNIYKHKNYVAASFVSVKLSTGQIHVKQNLKHKRSVCFTRIFHAC